MQVNDIIGIAIRGDTLPYCAPIDANERQVFDAWTNAGIVYGETPPPSLRDIVRAIEAKRGVSLAP